MRKFIKKNKKFIISIALLLLGQSFMYWFLKLFQSDPININYYLDNEIPFLGRFIYIYNAFYPFMVISFYLLYKADEKAYFKGIISGIIGFIICDIIFLSLPTIMFRPIIPSTDVITDFILKITFLFDSPPLNCFPSIHCLFCFQALYSTILSKTKTKNKIYISICSILIISSTLFVKQHYVFDVLSAFLVMLISNLITDLFNIDEFLKRKNII